MNPRSKYSKEHTAPWECTLTEEEKTVCRPGKIPKSEREYFEILSLCVLQAGLGWGMVRKNWAKFKRFFLGFNINKLADADVEELLNKPGGIKNRKKVFAIINNAQEFQKIKEKYGSFSDFLKVLREEPNDEAIMQLTQRFHHLGKYSGEYFLHSVGYL